MALSNDRMLEGLYGLGVDINVLRSIDKNLPAADFRRQLEQKGVPAGDFTKAQKLVEMRPEGTTRYKALQVMEAMGVTKEGIARFNKLASGNDNPKGVHAILKDILGPERAGNIMIKATGGKGVEGAVWNPYRGDTPPSGVDVKYGAMGVITGFNSGPDLPQPPTPTQQRQAANKAATAPGAGVPPGGGGPAPKSKVGAPDPNAVTPVKLPRTEAEVRAYIDENYSQWAYLQDIPEVWDKVKEAAKGGYSDDRVLGDLQKTGWWQKTEASARLWKEERHQDPATAQDKVNKKQTELEKAATAAGITIPPNELAALAEDALRFDWDPNETKSALGRFFRYDKDKLMGTALVTQQSLTAKARDWLVPMDDTTMQDWVTKVATGELDEEYFDGYMKQQAQTLFPQLADPISRGIAPGQWMSPYKTMAAQTLGINPDSIDLRESKWMKSINQVGPDGKRTAMNLSDWEDMLKTDETYGWDKTDSGREHGATMARKLAGMFRGNA